MKVYKLHHDYSDIYDRLHTDDNTIDLCNLFRGEELKEALISPVFTLISERKRSDFPHYLPDIPTVTEKTLRVIEPIFGHCFQPIMLNVQNKNERIFALNIVQIAELDVEKSKVKRFTSGRIMRIIEHSFKDEEIIDKAIFKIKAEGEIRRGYIFVTDRFKLFYEESGFNGLGFELIYSTELMDEDGDRTTKKITPMDTLNIIIDKYTSKNELYKNDEVIRNIYYACYIDGEVGNGGFAQYFWNSRGMCIKECLTALKVINANYALSAFQKAVNIFEEASSKEKSYLLDENIFGNQSSLYNKLNAITNEFYSSNELSLQSLVLDYIDSRKDYIHKVGILD